MGIMKNIFGSTSSNLSWTPLTSESELEEAISASHQKPVLLFKHSTRCSISTSALSRLERNWEENASESVSTYFLDLLAYRPISNQIEDKLGVAHQSPQALVLKNGKCVFHSSHFDITYDAIKEAISI